MKNAVDKTWSELYKNIKIDAFLGEYIKVEKDVNDDSFLGLHKEYLKISVKAWDRRCGICSEEYEPRSD